MYLGKTLIQEGESELVIRPAENLRAALADLRALHLVQIGGVPLATGMVADDEKPSKPPVTAAEIAARLIDDKFPATDRERLIAANLEKAAEIIPLIPSTTRTFMPRGFLETAWTEIPVCRRTTKLTGPKLSLRPKHKTQTPRASSQPQKA